MRQLSASKVLGKGDADFLIMLESWEAAKEFSAHAPERGQLTVIAKLLRWARGNDLLRAQLVRRAAEPIDQVHAQLPS